MKYPLWRIRRVNKGKIQLKSIKSSGITRFVNRVASATVLTVLLPVSAITTPVVSTPETAEASEVPNMVLDTESHIVVLVDPKVSAIVPGESVIEREARLKAEALEAEQVRVAAEQARIAAEAAARAQKQRATASREYRVAASTDNVDLKSLYQAAGSRYNVDPKLLEAIHYVETGKSGSTTKSSHMGATGPMQFIPSTWRSYGVDANGDGMASVHDVTDAMYGAANYLSKYPDMQSSIYGYNHSQSYVRKVMEVYNSIQ